MLGFGTAGLGSRTHEFVKMALEAGVTMIDTTQATEWYDELQVGNAVAEYNKNKRNRSMTSIETDKIMIVTKIHPRSFSLNKMDNMLRLSSHNLHVQSLDVVLLHAPWCWKNHCTTEEERVGWQEGWTNLESLKIKHQIRSIGVSNFGYDLLRELIFNVAVDPNQVSVIQNWMDPFHQDKSVRELAKQHGIQYMAYSSFGTQWRQDSFKLAAAGIPPGSNPVFSHPILQRIADKHYPATIAQIVLAWLHTEGIIAIPRSSSATHIAELFQSLNYSAPMELVIAPEGNGLAETKDSKFDKINNNSKFVVLDDQDLQDIHSLDGILGDPWD